MSNLPRVTLLGFGEVGQALAEEFMKLGVPSLTAWDTAFADPHSRASKGLSRLPVRAAESAADAVREADLVISAVTAAQDLVAAQSVAGHMPKGCFFLDLNSCSPGQKTLSAAAVDGAGGRYVEAAVMSPIEPKRAASPMLLGGPAAAELLELARPLGFTGAKVYSDIVGRAAATKLCRSVMIKGVEALATESMLAARHYGVEDVVLASLSDLLPLPDWRATATYMISRSLEHGTRRAEEMREAARTVAEAGVNPLMSEAIAERQDWAARHKEALAQKAGDGDLEAMLDAINKTLGRAAE